MLLFCYSEMQEKLRRSESLRNDLMRLIKEQELWKGQQERIAAEENEKMRKYIAEREQRIDHDKEQERKKLLAKLEQQDKMVSALNDIEVNFVHVRLIAV